MLEESLKEVLMRRDGLSAREAQDAIAEARARVEAGEDPEEVLAEEFGLEPNYIWDLLDTVTKEIADQVISGAFPEDRIVKIVEYDNTWGGKGYGLIAEGQPADSYASSDFVRNPRVYWERKLS